MKKKLLIAGAGGFGVEVAWVAESMGGWEVLGFVDDNPDLRDTEVDGYRVLGTPEELVKRMGDGTIFCHVAIGKNRSRMKVAPRLEGLGWKPATLIHSSAVIAKGVVLGEGCFVGPLAVIAPFARLGSQVLVNASSGVGHHAFLGDGSQICPGARVNGHCKVDTLGFIGSNSSLNPGVRVGEGAVVGSNSLVIRSVEPLVTVLGVPARIISRPA